MIEALRRLLGLLFPAPAPIPVPVKRKGKRPC
jgi:hypothetical protein